MATFTALNGGSPKATDGVNGSVEMARTGSAEKQGNGPSQSSEPTKAAVAEPSTSQRERDNWAGPTLDRASYQNSNYPDMENSHKRKRSDSLEGRRELQTPLERPDQSPAQRPHSAAPLLQNPYLAHNLRPPPQQAPYMQPSMASSSTFFNGGASQPQPQLQPKKSSFWHFGKKDDQTSNSRLSKQRSVVF